MIGYETALKINKRSFSHGNDYHVGLKGLDLIVTHKSGWTIKTEKIVDNLGHEGLHVWHEKITNWTMNHTDTVNVLSHLQELRKTWKIQDFRFTKDQQEQYDMLLQARRERVKYFYENDLVQKGPRVEKKAVEVEEDQDS